MVTIIADCPHCGRKRILEQGEIETLIKLGGVVITECTCGKMYKVEQDTECFFVTG